MSSLYLSSTNGTVICMTAYSSSTGELVGVYSYLGGNTMITLPILLSSDIYLISMLTLALTLTSLCYHLPLKLLYLVVTILLNNIIFYVS